MMPPDERPQTDKKAEMSSMGGLLDLNKKTQRCRETSSTISKYEF